jgi:DNA-binding CsgD family transcriptional regulator
VITVNPAITQLKAARLLGAAYRLRQQTGYQRFRLHQPGYDATVAELRAALGEQAFGQAWDEGAALGLDDAMNYALRGRGERGRPSVGWLSLTPAERDVARPIAEGPTNKEIALRLFVSPRTVQTHLTHMYGKTRRYLESATRPDSLPLTTGIGATVCWLLCRPKFASPLL